MSLLRTIDAAAAVLLRVVSNVLHLRTLTGNAPPQPPPARAPRLFSPRAAVARVLETVRALDTVPQRLAIVAAPPGRALPARALGDEETLCACLLNLTLTAMRMGAGVERVPVRLRIAAQLRARAPPPRSPSALAGAEHVSLRVAAESASEAEPTAAEPTEARVELLLHALADTPCRALSAAELSAVFEPAGMLPADLGGSTGLPLQVARTLARAAGGDVVIYPTEASGTDGAMALTLWLPLRVQAEEAAAALVEAEQQAAAQEGAAAGPPAPDAPATESPRLSRTPRAATPQLPPQRTGPQPADQLALTQSMFAHLLTRCADVFALARAHEAAPGGATAFRFEYVSPSVEGRFGVAPAAMLGRDVREMCHPEDRAGFSAALAGAHASAHTAAGGRFAHLHRGYCFVPPGSAVWCSTEGVFRGDALWLACRDVRPTKSVELGLRAFSLATSHELREPCNTILVSLAVLGRCAGVAAAASSALPPSALAERAGGTGTASSAAAAMREPVGARELIGIMGTAARLLEGIVANVITAPQLEAGELPLRRGVFSPGALMDDILRICRLGTTADLAAGRLRRNTRIDWLPPAAGEAPLPALVEGDRDRVAQIVQNLVTNAVKVRRGAPRRAAQLACCAARKPRAGS